MKNNRWKSALLALSLLSVAFIGCKTHLAPGGAYAPNVTNITANADGTSTTNVVATAAPDQAFFEVDSAFDLAYSVINAAFTFELDNRDYLWSISPQVKHTLDKIRPQALDARNQYLKARRIYIANPTPAGLGALQTALTQIQHASSAAEAVLPKPQPNR